REIMNEVSPRDISVHTQLAIRLLHAFEYREDKIPFLQDPVVSGRPFFGEELLVGESARSISPISAWLNDRYWPKADPNFTQFLPI
ncbi:MAG: hypothetical protein V3R72_02370, partial [Gammaproteobacteria bacterium]